MSEKSEISIKQPKLEIPASENKIENEKHFNDRFREAKVMLTMFAAGQDVTTIAGHFRIAISRVKEITELGLEKTEKQLRRWYEMKKIEKPQELLAAPVTPTEEVPVEAPVVNEPVVAGVPVTRIKGGVKIAEEKIVEMVSAKPEGMPVKDLKAAAPAGLNPNTWVLCITRLKKAGKVTIVEGMVKAV